MSTTHLTVLDPTEVGAESNGAEFAELPRDLAGVRLGLLDNGKPNSDRFLAMLAERFVARGALLHDTRRKPSIGRLAPADMLQELVGACDLIVTGVGDCAGCCSCSVQDGVAIERAGVPTVVVVTTEFLTTARLSARAAGIAGFPFVVIDHPLGSLTPQLLEQRADVAMDQVHTRRAAAR